MQNFIVLGIIPGTNYQTTFSFWLWVSFGLLAVLSVPRFVRALKRLRSYLAARRVEHSTDKFDLITI